MTEKLRHAFAQIATLSEREQDYYALLILAWCRRITSPLPERDRHAR